MLDVSDDIEMIIFVLGGFVAISYKVKMRIEK